jgi:hypothetical protein
MTGKQFWATRKHLYARRPYDDPTYWCKGCDHELDSGYAGQPGHEPDCPVAWFERTFYKPEFRALIR